MKKIVIAKIILAMMCFLCFGLRADASESQGEGTGINMDDIEEIDMGEGHTITITDGGKTVIETIRTNDNQRIITQIGDDISEFYEDYATGIAVVTLNGRVIELFDMNEFRKETDRHWERFDRDKIVWGIAIIIGVVFIAGGIWSVIPSKKK